MSVDEIQEDEKRMMSVTHAQYLFAVNNPIRRSILEALCECSLTIEEIETKTKLSKDLLKWHIAVLESGSFPCIEEENNQGCIRYRLTKAGKVINYMA
jgi:DNA-binding transcriptional ArsR family regulator